MIFFYNKRSYLTFTMRSNTGFSKSGCYGRRWHDKDLSKIFIVNWIIYIDKIVNSIFSILWTCVFFVNYLFFNVLIHLEILIIWSRYSKTVYANLLSLLVPLDLSFISSVTFTQHPTGRGSLNNPFAVSQLTGRRVSKYNTTLSS